MDKKDLHHAELVPKIRKTNSSAAVSTMKRLAAPKSIKVVPRPVTAGTHAAHNAAKVSATLSPKDNTFAIKARKEWEQAMMARKCHERAPKAFTDPVRRKRPGDVSPSDASAENIRPVMRPPEVTVSALKGLSSTASSNVVSPSAYAARRSITSPANSVVRRVTSQSRFNKSDLVSTQSVTILRIREPERVPATDLDIPVVNNSTNSFPTNHHTPEPPSMKPPQRCDPAPIKPSSFCTLSTITASSTPMSTPAKGAILNGNLGPSPGSSGSSPPKLTLQQHSASSTPNSRSPSFMSMPPAYAVKPASSATLTAASVTGVTQPRTIAFVFPVLQSAVQQGIISAHQCHQLTSLFATKPLPAAPAELDVRGVGSLNAVQPSWSPLPQQPLHPKVRSTEMVLPATKATSYHSPGPPARTPLQSPPPPARHPPARDVKDAAIMLDDRQGRRADGGADAKELFNAVCSALQKQPGRKEGSHSHHSTLNGHRHSADNHGLPSSPTSSCGSFSDSSSVVSESVVMLPTPESPKPARAVLYRTFSGDTVVIPPLNFRLLRK
eukprot:GGOE01045935.1.p1 GENE.GGOE01045935.1~~GGOE01045935.1.p1  ORF type:complete len:582 (-),score=81.03 GGOE01045935.1:558-2216(-)